jgi:hypothetical protein
VPVLRLYIIGLVAFVIELNSILLLLKQGGFSAKLNLGTLVGSVALSYWARRTSGSRARRSGASR